MSEAALPILGLSIDQLMMINAHCGAMFQLWDVDFDVKSRRFLMKHPITGERIEVKLSELREMLRCELKISFKMSDRQRRLVLDDWFRSVILAANDQAQEAKRKPAQGGAA